MNASINAATTTVPWVAGSPTEVFLQPHFAPRSRLAPCLVFVSRENPVRRRFCAGDYPIPLAGELSPQCESGACIKYAQR